jgi:hypothetical protein
VRLGSHRTLELTKLEDTMQTERALNGRTESSDSALSVPVDLDLLSRLNTAELSALYRRARLPASLGVLDGTPRGRMLAIVPPLDRGLAFAALRGFAASRAFPWGGKSFASGAAQGSGSGINRALLLGDIFRFDTRVAPSAVDGEPCIVLDYDQPENPWFIRRIHDELREVAPGLYLGPAMWKSQSGPRLVLHFAIDTRG